MSHALTKLMQAKALLDSGKPDAALSGLQRLAPRMSADADFNELMALVLGRLGRAEHAAFYAKRAVDLNPGEARTHFNLAFMLVGCGKTAESSASLRRALELRPNYPDARLALANNLLEEHQAAAALEELRTGLSYGAHPQLSVSYANALLSITDVEEAVEFLRRAIGQFPGESLLLGGLPSALNNLHGADPREIAAAHRAFGGLMVRTRPPFTRTKDGVRDPERRLRIGVISPDLRAHSVAFFAEPFFERHDRSKFEVVAYATNSTSDAVSARFKTSAAAWRDCWSMNPVQVARRVADDSIDVLVDLAGHTDATCLAVLALKAAPVQVTYCGYPDSTGLPTVDWRIVDGLTDPPGGAAAWNGGISFDDRATERLWRLDPCFLCYRPPREAPEPARDGAFPGPTFGSFNACKKLSRGVIALWARVLRASPSSRLMIKAFDLRDPIVHSRLIERFEGHGVDRARLEFLPATKGMAEHLALYSRMDVGLDPTPYNGTTTTCEALWMGVPVVTLAGATHAGRVGVSLLTNVGVPELVARDEEEYVRLAVDLSQDRDRLARLRSSLRGMMQRSPLCDEAAFVDRFAEALRDMWRRWCGEQATRASR